MRRSLPFFILTCSLVSAVCAVEPSRDAGQWSRFRGPAGTGESDETELPRKLDADCVAWTSDLPVRGHSSPIVWNDRVFLTGTSGSGEAVKRHVICVDRNTGRLLWNEVAAEGGGESLHKMNSWATPSCATDGQRVVAFFGTGGLHCYTVDGKPIWSRDLGQFPGKWGVGASPIFYKSTVIQNCDAEGDSYLLAVDAKTGEEIWKTPRRAKPRGGWSTPVVIDTGERIELVLNGEFGVQSYNPATGKPLWNCQSFNGRGTPAPAWGNGVLYMVNGKSGDVYAVQPGGEGDVTETKMVWHTPRGGGRDLPSPVLAENVMVVVGMSGVATGYDALSGEELWKQRLGGNFSGSPVVADNLIYVASEEGEIIIMDSGQQPAIVSRASIRIDEDEVFRSSIAIHNGQLLVRSDRRLYCVGK